MFIPSDYRQSKNMDRMSYTADALNLISTVIRKTTST